ncbi:PRC-barrel domain-containing protein [Rhodobacteraceae bacterium NNCM2]|nr:PRC-barrel domain-containing protein [Coraliihabitans acroporae]
MKIFSFATAAATSTLVAGAALADCQVAMTDFEETYGDTPVEMAGSDVANRQVVRQLRSAALILQQQNKDAACETVVGALSEVTESFGKNRQDITAANEDIRADVVDFTTTGAFYDTTDLVGTNIYNYDNEFVAEVDGVLMPKEGEAGHLIVSYGGFWNIGDREVAVPFSAVKWHPEYEMIYADLSEERLAQAPDYDRTNGEWSIDQNDSYYEAFME